MNKLDLFKMSWDSLLRRKTRTILTILGVVIGTCSIIVMLSLGIAMDRGFQEFLQEMGDLTVIEVYPQGQFMGGQGSSRTQQRQTQLNDATISSFNKIPGVKAVMATREKYMRIGAGRHIANVNVVGVDPEVMESFGFTAEEGRLLHANDRESMVFGHDVPHQFYNPRLRQSFHYGPAGDEAPPVDVLTSSLLITSDMSHGDRQTDRPDHTDDKEPLKHDVRGVGILERSHDQKDYQVFMSLSSFESILEQEQRHNRETQNRSQRDEYDSVRIKAASINEVDGILKLLQDQGYQTFSLTQILDDMKNTARMTQAILGGIGAVSLLVAAIGITNTMIMSIYERTREIGVMKVIGATLSDIKGLFLIEAGLIGFGGGLLGVCFSYLISYGLNQLGSGFMGPGSAQRLSIIPISLALAALLFSTVVGLIAGYSPARRAMKLSALEAIRND
ncbi:ABC-type transport system, involved in lipoprotein release, permease component [Tindallia magadiensis]|uniref:ABC-type transport system, involved in lipoprotein release, permease component n=1 Tax=Tindallia magadiensis TaxID=69895 RepID=A0A1I3E491_9FIRM|nr:ABC transporter permease [Tindallia magadiensis]SFH93668.1 ABC-type transport system, involved in lipoprotein release, permease component [Tindallia magadiensis]